MEVKISHQKLSSTMKQVAQAMTQEFCLPNICLFRSPEYQSLRSHIVTHMLCFYYADFESVERHCLFDSVAIMDIYVSLLLHKIKIHLENLETIGLACLIFTCQPEKKELDLKIGNIVEELKTLRFNVKTSFDFVMEFSSIIPSDCYDEIFENLERLLYNASFSPAQQAAACLNRVGITIIDPEFFTWGASTSKHENVRNDSFVSLLTPLLLKFTNIDLYPEPVVLEANMLLHTRSCNAETLVSSDAVDMFMKHIKVNYRNLCVQVCVAMCNIVVECPAYVMVLLQLVKEKIEISRIINYAIHSKPQVIYALYPLIVELATIDDILISKEILLTLKHITNKGIGTELVVNHFAHFLMKSLLDSKTCYTTLLIIGNIMSEEDDTYIEIFLQLHLLEKIPIFLCQNANFRKEVLFILSNIATGTVMQIKRLQNHPIMDYVAAELTLSADKSVRRRAFLVFFNAAKYNEHLHNQKICFFLNEHLSNLGETNIVLRHVEEGCNCVKIMRDDIYVKTNYCLHSEATGLAVHSESSPAKNGGC